MKRREFERTTPEAVGAAVLNVCWTGWKRLY